MLLQKYAAELGEDLVNGLINADQKDETGIYEQRERVNTLREKIKAKLNNGSDSEARNDFVHLESLADYLVKKEQVWKYN